MQSLLSFYETIVGLDILPLLIFYCLGLPAYLFLALSLTSLSRAAGIGKAAMAWFPFSNLYLMGLLADRYTDLHLTTDQDRTDPFYAPSTLRKKLLGYGIATAITGFFTAVGITLLIAGAAFAFFVLLGAFAGGDGQLADSGMETLGILTVVGLLLAFVAGVILLVVGILFLTAYCTASYRLFKAVELPVPGLLTACGVLIPALAFLFFFVYTRRSDRVAERFRPQPPDAPADTATYAPSDEAAAP